jgi:hypothetical protein
MGNSQVVEADNRQQATRSVRAGLLSVAAGTSIASRGDDLRGHHSEVGTRIRTPRHAPDKHRSCLGVAHQAVVEAITIGTGRPWGGL